MSQFEERGGPGDAGGYLLIVAALAGLITICLIFS